MTTIQCPQCLGSGTLQFGRCEKCSGAGRLPVLGDKPAMTPTEGRAEDPHDYGMTIMATDGRNYIQRSDGIAYNIAPGDVCIDGRVIANCWCGTNHREKAEYHAYELARRYNAVPELEQQLAEQVKMIADLRVEVSDKDIEIAGYQERVGNLATTASSLRQGLADYVSITKHTGKLVSDILGDSGARIAIVGWKIACEEAGKKVANLQATNAEMLEMLKEVQKRWTFNNEQQHTHTWHDWADVVPFIAALIRRAETGEK